MTQTTNQQLDRHLQYLKLPYIREQARTQARQAADKKRTYLDYLGRLAEGEVAQRRDRAIQRAIKAARFPLIKTLDQFNFDWPKKINALQVKDLFRLNFLQEHGNVVFLGGVGMGKTHLAGALGHAACLQGHRVLFANTIDVVNTLEAAQAQGRLKAELKKYQAPRLLILDELGYLPIDQRGADLLFQVISHRYERGSILLTTNKPFKEWAGIFNNDATIASAVLDRLLHHAETVVIEGKSYRMKDRAET